MANAIELRDVFRIYRTEQGDAAALQGLTLDVAQGEVAVVLGPSGAGKSTLLHILAALDRPSAGTVRVLGVEPARLGARAAAAYRARSLGFLDQHYTRSLSQDLTSRETISLQPALLGGDPRACTRRADELLERVGLGDRGDARPDELSGGERQRVALCAALAHRPQLLLADEPSGELDAESGALVYSLIGELARDHATTVVMVSHDSAATEVADRTLHIRDGRLGEEGRRGAETALVVDRGGWVRLPEELRRESGIATRVQARPADDGIVLVPARPGPQARATEPARVGETASAQAVVAQLRDVEKRFGDRIVFSALDAAFAGGRFAAVVGRSGVGKTTLLHLLAGLERVSGGDVVVLGESLTGYSRAQLADFRRRHVALVRQEPSLIPFLSAVENVELALRVRDVDGDRPADARAALERLELGHRLDQRVARLSIGERQRVAIARALAARPSLLLVDEPTAHLDEANARLTARLLARAAHEEGVAVVSATHDPALVEAADDELRLS